MRGTRWRASAGGPPVDRLSSWWWRPLLMDVVIRAYGWIVLLSSGGLVNALILALRLSDGPVQLLYTEWAVVAGGLKARETLAGRKVALILSGGNLDTRLLPSLLHDGDLPEATGEVSTRPGGGR